MPAEFRHRLRLFLVSCWPREFPRRRAPRPGAGAGDPALCSRSGWASTLGILNVFFRDVGQFFAIFLQFWFWLTPIVYPRHPARGARPVGAGLNPMSRAGRRPPGHPGARPLAGLGTLLPSLAARRPRSAGWAAPVPPALGRTGGRALMGTITSPGWARPTSSTRTAGRAWPSGCCPSLGRATAEVGAARHQLHGASRARRWASSASTAPARARC